MSDILTMAAIAATHAGAFQQRIATLEAQLTAAQAQVEALKAHLRRYGWHDDGCDFLLEAIECTCGFEAVRASVAEGEHGR